MVLAEFGALTAATAILYLAGVAPAAAQYSASPPPECALIESDVERLACYDRAQRTPAETPTVSTGSVPPIPAAITTRPAESAAEQRNVPVVIAAIRQRQGMNTLFTTDQGQIWAQVDFEQNYFPRPPFSAEIRPGRLGSFFLVPTNGTAVRVRLRDSPQQ